MKKLTAAEMISHYRLELVGDQVRIGFSDLAKKENAMPELREAKSEIIEILKSAEAERKAAEAIKAAKFAKMIKIVISGWEAETIYVDPEEALENQIPSQSTLDYIGISAEQALEQIKTALGRNEEKKAQEIAELETKIAELDGKELPSAALAKVMKTTWNNVHNEGGEGFVPEYTSREELEAMKNRLTTLKA